MVEATGKGCFSKEEYLLSKLTFSLLAFSLCWTKEILVHVPLESIVCIE